MTKDEIFTKIRDILVSEFELKAADIKPESKLFEDLDLDSIDAIDLIVKLKEFVTGKIDPEIFKSVRTVQDVVDIIYPLANGK
ncbi:MAG: acyl carrier protein [Treponema sp.]|jgi:acyl carrier protein|nr:acyl carrier protein [Treponema sp.]